MDQFVNIHFHTDGSVLDSPATTETMLDAVKSKNQNACVISDHGSLSNVPSFFREANNRGIKPILGEEFYLVKEGVKNTEATKMKKTDNAMAIQSGIYGLNHIVVLAKNEIGWKNLIKLNHLSVENYYYNSRIDLDLLEQHKEGLIVSSACMFGLPSQAIIRGDIKTAEDFVGRMQSVFKDDFYLEIQMHGYSDQIKYIAEAKNISTRTGCNLVVAQDCHYAQEQDWKYQDALFCIGSKALYSDPERRKACQQLFVKNRSEMEAAFAGLDIPISALNNTMEIANKVERYELQPKGYLLPRLYGTIQESQEELKQYCRIGWKDKILPIIGQNKQKKALYLDRLQYELAVINSMGFTDYILIVVDYMNWAIKHGIKVGARGSAAGSLVCYLACITDLDPILYGLPFERFLVPGRPTMPDIDVDVSDRESIIAYLGEKYGHDKVAPIINKGRASCKKALGSVASILGNFKLGTEISKSITTTRGKSPTFKEALENTPSLQIEKRKNPLLFELAEGLEGTTLFMSGHASGVVLSSVPLNEVMPIQKSGDKIYTAYDMEDVNYVKMIKLDILGQDSLAAIKLCQQYIKERHNIDVYPEKLVPNDPKVYELINSLDLVGIFQLESPGMQKLIKGIKIANLDDLAVINALYRPGPIDAKLDDLFISRKNGLEIVEYAHPALKPILEPTYGLQIYQEQVMAIAKDLAGMDPIKVDKFRKCMSDKNEEAMAAIKPEFTAGFIKNGYTSELADQLFKDILYFSGYGFNKSHAMAYGYRAYQTAWLKTYYPTEFLLAYLNVHNNAKTKDLDEIIKFVTDIERHGIKVEGPDITTSDKDFTIKDTTIKYALSAIKDVSYKNMHSWLNNRPFASLDDCIGKATETGINSKTLTALAKVGAFSKLATNRKHVELTMVGRIETCRKEWAKYKKKLQKLLLQQEMFNLPRPVFDYGDRHSLALQQDNKDKSIQSKNEMELIGLSLSFSPLEMYSIAVRAKSDGLVSWFKYSVAEEELVRVAGILSSIDRKQDRNGKTYISCVFTDGRASVRALIFNTIYAKYSDSTWKIGLAISLKGIKDSKGSLIVRDCALLKGNPESCPQVNTDAEQMQVVQTANLELIQQNREIST